MRSRNLKFWLLNAICGLLLLVLAGTHLSMFHLDDVMASLLNNSTEPLAWERVSARGASIAYALVYILMLGTALFHGFYGLHTVLTEIWSGKRAVALVNFVCWFAGLGLFAIGTVAAISFHVML